MPAPLPRSLVPLPGEALPGYLLRLTHRLGLTPARILQLTGLAGGEEARFPSRASHELMISLSPAAREALGRATRLEAAEIDSLCLDSLAPRYPLPGPETRRGAFTQRADWWIFSTATRYCPRCLADGSQAGSAHGGAWQRSWRLPVTFACTRHQRLLDHLCPACRRPALETSAGNARIPILPGLKIGGLHPAQCRSHDARGNSGMTRKAVSACGARLDKEAPPAAAAPSAVMDLQERLTALLDPAGPQTVTSAGHPVEPARYFTDLRLLATLIVRSWPRARHLAPSGLAEAIDQHVALQGKREQPPARRRLRAAHASDLARPLDPAAGAGLLLIADQILRLPEPPDVREALQPLLPPDWASSSYRFSWAGHFPGSTQKNNLSGLLKAVNPLIRAYPKQRAARVPEIRTGLDPACIPALLPREHFDRHLRHVEGINPDHVRRIASARLVQMILGGSLGDAAQFLGITTYTSKGSYTAVSACGVLKWARSRPDPGEFDAIMEKIIGELSASRLVNYKHLRDTLRNWTISPQDWARILDDKQAGLRSEQAPPEQEPQRRWASALVWAEVTQGEPVFAPHLAERQGQPRLRPREWPRRLETAAQTSSAIDLALVTTLTSYAAELAAQIDDTALRGRGPANALPAN